MQNTLIIAEAGVNHNGDISLAKDLAKAAKEAGADIVKYQTTKLSSLVTGVAKMANYQLRNTGIEESQYEMLKKITLPFEAFDEIFGYCEKIGIVPLSTPFDIDSIDFLKKYNMPFWKIPSGEITNYPYLVRIAETKMPVVLSTGMSDIAEVEETLEVLRKNGTTEISLLHCNTQYPTPYEDANLLAMVTLKNKFGLKIGYSDHTEGIEVPIAAVAMGATIIEKHFTLDKGMIGPDHRASLEPHELKKMIDSIRNIEKAFGDGTKIPSKSEIENKVVARKSIVASKKIKKGEILSENNITTKRPGNGVCPMKWKQVIGHKAVRDFAADELIEL